MVHIPTSPIVQMNLDHYNRFRWLVHVQKFRFSVDSPWESTQRVPLFYPLRTYLNRLVTPLGDMLCEMIGCIPREDVIIFEQRYGEARKARGGDLARFHCEILDALLEIVYSHPAWMFDRLSVYAPHMHLHQPLPPPSRTATEDLLTGVPTPHKRVKTDTSWWPRGGWPGDDEEDHGWR